MKIVLALLLATAACGGSSKPATTPQPEPAPEPTAAATPEPTPAPAPAPEPPPAPEPAPPPAPPSFGGWWASADASVLLADDGKATIENKKKKATKKGTWDAAAATLTVDKKATPLKLDGEQLVVSVGGAEQKLWRQPTTFDTTFSNDGGSLQLKADGTCIHGVAGMPANCTYKLEGGKLAITYAKEAKKKPVTWVVWFENNGKVLHTPKDTFNAL